MATRTVEVANGVPALAAERAVSWPKRTKARLSNGLEVILAESHSIPKFHGELFFRSGNTAVADRAPGLAEMTATVVRTGTAKRESRQIEEDLRRIGADLSSNAGADTSAISFAGLSEMAEPLLGLVNELAREASFPEGEFERERRQKLEEVKLERTEPGFLASERLRRVLFGAHPYGQVSPSEAQVAAYKREDLQTVYREAYTPENGLLLMVGDFDSQDMLKSAEKVFGAWRGKKPEAKTYAAPANPRGRRVYLAHVPGAVQT
jgi:zinc protease